MTAPDPPPEDWASRWEQAARSTVQEAGFEGVYTGPAWQEAVSVSPDDPRMWKLAVLQRRAGGGAEHWGHLFVLLVPAGTAVRIQPEAGWIRHPPGADMECVERTPGAPWEVRFRPRSPETAERLRRFAQAFQRHAAEPL